MARPGLKPYLDRLRARYDARYLGTSALLTPRQYTDPADRELAGFLAAVLAYGNVVQIHRSVRAVLGAMPEGPAGFVQRFDPRRDTDRFADFVHRFNRGRDVALLCWWLRQGLDEHGSLEDAFLVGYDEADADIGPALTRFVAGMLSRDARPFYPRGPLPAHAGVRFFLPSPADGSPCKRLNLFLRWMIRPDDGIDFGLWKAVPPAKLIIPLDTHVARIARRLGLTRRLSPSWRMAVEITERLRAFDPDDPVKYDYALCRHGILESRRLRGKRVR